MIGIYKVTNPKNRIYIGQSTDILKRWNQYRNLECETQRKLYNSLKKYGVEAHKFEIITECDIEDLNNLERYYQELYNVIDPKCGLNLKLTKSDSRSGEHSEETKRKIGAKHKGKKMSDESKRKMRIANIGKKMSVDSCKKISESRKKLFENGYVNPLAKMVIDLETGFIYNSGAECYKFNKDYIKVNLNTFLCKLSGNKKNNTKFQFI